MPRGGKRPGAGRKARAKIGADLLNRACEMVAVPGTEVQAEGELPDLLTKAGDELQRTILANQERLALAMLDLACGVYVEEVDVEDPEARRVYQRPPDRQAIQWLMEMTHGKPTQKQVTVADTTINVVHHIPRATALPAEPDDVIDVPVLPSGE